MNRKPLEGVFPLMPFVIRKNQELDLEGLTENIEFLSESDVHGFIAFGCMGEFYAPSPEEFNKVVDVAVDASGRLATVFGATFQNTKESIRRAKYAEDAGADGVMVAPPYVINPTLETALEHYRLINESIEEIQIMAYNYPPLARDLNMTPEFWDDLIKMDRIKALKESNGDTIHRSRVISKIADRINVFSGGEAWFFADSLLGAKGIVSLFGIAVPKAVLALHNACKHRDMDRAIELHRAFSELSSYITSYNEVAFLKATAEIGGRKAGPPRSPYPQLDAKIYEVLKEFLLDLASIE